MRNRWFVIAALSLAPCAAMLASLSSAQAQGTVLQAGPQAPGRAPMYNSPTTSQPVIRDSGPAAGGPAGVGLKELGITVRGTGTPPFANQGSGPLGTNFCMYDAPITNAAGYHYLCLDPNAQGGALIAYGAANGATPLPLQFNINGSFYPFPGSGVSQWITSGLNIYYNLGNVGIGTASPTAQLHTTGSVRFGALGAGIGTLSSNGTVSSTKSYTTSIVYAADSGVVADGITLNNTSIQSAIDDCLTPPRSGKGCIIQFPCGKIRISTEFPINIGATLAGCGPGAARVLPGGAVNVGGTVFVQECTTCNTFVGTALDPFQFRDLGFDGPFNATAGSFIYLRPSASPSGHEQNLQSVVTNVGFVGGFDQLTCEACGNYSFFNNVFRSPARDAISLKATAAFSDQGDASIYANTFWVLLDSSPLGFQDFGRDCIRIATQSGLKIFGNKMLLCDVAVHIIASQGGAGVVQAFGNNIEEQKRFHFLIEQGTAGITYGGISITDNHTGGSSTYPLSFVGAVGILAGAAPYLSDVQINGNSFNIGQGVSGARCIFINDGDGVIVSNNRCEMNNLANHGGITVGGNATNVSLLDNKIRNVAAGQPRYDLTVAALVRDLYGMPLASFSALFAGGSTIYVKDGKSTNIGAGNFTVTGGGNGCVVWVNSVPNATCVSP